MADDALAMLLAGEVDLGGAGSRNLKPGQMVADDAALTVVERPRWASRAGEKLAGALDAFEVDPGGLACLDAGASTGGFTDVLLQRGAREIIALDVGHGQLDWKLRTDPRVRVLEGINARHLDPALIGAAVDVVTIDVSFISLRLVLPSVPAIVAPDADVIALVKPQFEAGREDVGRGGIVADPAVHDRVLAEVTAAASGIGLSRIGMTPSPITGAAGNREFLVHFRSAS